VLTYVILSAAATEFYLTSDGHDGQDCRTLPTSCQTFNRIMRDVRDGDVINVDEEGSHLTASGCRWLCNEDSVVQIEVSVTVIGIRDIDRHRNKTAMAPCADCSSFDEDETVVSGRLVVFNVSGSNSLSPVVFRLENLVLANVTFLVVNSHVAFIDCVIVDSIFSKTSSSNDDEVYVGLELIDTLWKTMIPGTAGNATREVSSFLNDFGSKHSKHRT
jgi:hypothetical protein